jgi:hypothetical protein
MEKFNMDRCKFCGESIDWNNINIHYSGHTCDEAKLNKIGATRRFVGSLEKDYTPKNTIVETKQFPQFEQKNKLSWKDVFDSYKLYPNNYSECLAIAKPTNYKYIAFNGSVYSIYDYLMKDKICSEDDLN